MKDAVIQVVTAFIISGGFSVLYNVRGKHILINSLGGALAWAIYLFLSAMGGGLFWNFFGSTAVIAALCYALAKVIKAPVTIMLVPMIITLIPGGLLYRTVYNIITGNLKAAEGYFYELCLELSGINFAIISVAALSGIIYSVNSYRKRRI